MDLRKKGMGGLKADLVHASRFLERKLFPEIRDEVLRPGGVVIWSHFLEGCEKLAPPLRCAQREEARGNRLGRERRDSVERALHPQLRQLSSPPLAESALCGRWFKWGGQLSGPSAQEP